MFGLSKLTKLSMLAGATALVLFGLGYVISSTTGLIDELTENTTKKMDNDQLKTDEKDNETDEEEIEESL